MIELRQVAPDNFFTVVLATGIGYPPVRLRRARIGASHRAQILLTLTEKKGEPPKRLSLKRETAIKQLPTLEGKAQSKLDHAPGQLDKVIVGKG